MKKAIFTILGMIGETGKVTAYYYNDKKIETINALTLLINEHSRDYEIVGFTTPEAYELQKGVISNLNIAPEVIRYVHIDDTNNYDKLFKAISDEMEMYDEVIIDITHGFRHLPVLMIISAIIQNIKNSGKISSILFGKEIEKKSSYEMVDLIEYLDLANIAYVLASFSEDYTVSRHIKFRNKLYQELVDKLGEFSQNILANSLKNLSENGSLIDKIISHIQTIESKEKKIGNLSNYLHDIKEHLLEIKKIASESKDSYRLYQFSSMMNEKWYLLNAITLLNEAIGMYCAESMMKYDPKIKKHFETVQLGFQGIYNLTSQAFAYINNPSKFEDKKEVISKDFQKVIDIQIKTAQSVDKIAFSAFKTMISEASKLRNNLAHGNSGEAISKVQNDIKKLIGQFKSLCIDADVLKFREPIETSKPENIEKKNMVIVAGGIRKKV